jgi:hypothetical protein
MKYEDERLLKALLNQRTSRAESKENRGWPRYAVEERQPIWNPIFTINITVKCYLTLNVSVLPLSISF